MKTMHKLTGKSIVSTSSKYADSVFRVSEFFMAIQASDCSCMYMVQIYAHTKKEEFNNQEYTCMYIYLPEYKIKG